jgi:hypothetical protein
MSTLHHLIAACEYLLLFLLSYFSLQNCFGNGITITEKMFYAQVYPDGKMSQHFANLKPGDVLEVKG